MQGGYDRIKKQIDTSEKTLANAYGELNEAKKSKDKGRIEKTQATIEKLEKELEEAQSKVGGATQYYEVEHDRKAVHLTHEGIGAAQEAAGVGFVFHRLEYGMASSAGTGAACAYCFRKGKRLRRDGRQGRHRR